MSRVATDLHGHLNMLLVKTNFRAVLNCIVDSVVQCSCVIGCTLNKYLIRNYYTYEIRKKNTQYNNKDAFYNVTHNLQREC